MDKQTALEILIAEACCGNSILTCDECPLYLPSEDEEDLTNNCSWTEEQVAEAVRVLKGGADR